MKIAKKVVSLFTRLHSKADFHLRKKKPHCFWTLHSCVHPDPQFPHETMLPVPHYGLEKLFVIGLYSSLNSKHSRAWILAGSINCRCRVPRCFLVLLPAFIWREFEMIQRRHIVRDLSGRNL